MRESAALKPADVEAKSSAEDIIRCFTESIANGDHDSTPYPHWVLKNCFPEDTIQDIQSLPFPAPSLDGVSGKRELHNATRKYFDIENRDKHDSVNAVSEAFQDKRITDTRRCSAPTWRARICVLNSRKIQMAFGWSPILIWV
jgi:hypothetical protein